MIIQSDDVSKPRRSRGRRGWAVLVGVITAVFGVMTLIYTQQNAALAAAGDPLPAINCASNYTATIYAEGLSSPDGLAFGPDGLLYVAEEAAGRVSQIGPTGAVTPVLAGLSNPEGIAFDDGGNLYVVEDVPNGRLLKRTPAGVTTTLASGLDAPEGVAAAADGTVYVTESNIQFEANPLQWRSHVTAVSPGGGVTRLITSTPVIVGLDVEFLSYSGITLGSDGLLYVANETAGVATPQPPLTLTTTKSIMTVNPTTTVVSLFSVGLTAPEGLRFSGDGQFPLYAAEEDTGGGQGRVSRLASDGQPAQFCTGFGTVEDVIVGGNGWLYVSDDLNGRVVRLDNGWPYSAFLPMVSAE